MAAEKQKNKSPNRMTKAELLATLKEKPGETGQANPIPS